MRKVHATPIRTPSPTMRTLFRLAAQKGQSAKLLAWRIGTNPPTISKWRQGALPNIMMVEAFAAALNLRLTLEPLDEVPHPMGLSNGLSILPHRGDNEMADVLQRIDAVLKSGAQPDRRLLQEAVEEIRKLRQELKEKTDAQS